MAKNKGAAGTLLKSKLEKHFKGNALSDLTTARRMFPVTARVDLQRSLESLFKEDYPSEPLGIYREYTHRATKFADLFESQRNPATVGPLHYDEVDVGNQLPERCLSDAVWLAADANIPFAVMITQSERYSGDGIGVIIEVAVPPGEQSLEISHKILTTLEKKVAKAGSYRGKVISLEKEANYSGQAGSILVHKLHAVTREQLILPEATVKLLERNVMQFIAQRQRLKELGMPVKKGLLLYGPPGTGKTHTIHYLASQLPDHTTLLITAAEVGLLSEYFQLARYLQPAIIVIEDADLIARERTQMDNPCEEALLNQLLNEMDGLRQDAAILFILTTNRPDQIEAALAARPGRIDQAIEFPLPDATARASLIKLYSCGLELPKRLLEDLVERTDGASPAFIKELLRRAAQHYLQDGAAKLKKEHFDTALEDMLLHGGTLNIKLLGGKLKV